MRILRLALALVCWTAGCAAEGSELAEVLADGDVVLHKSRSSQAAALRAATGSPYTHVGLVFEGPSGLRVLEAVEPVRWTPLDPWVARGEEGHVVALRLREPLDAEKVRAVRQAGEAWLGRHYDGRFEWSDDRIYCSELVYKAYRTVGVELGELAPLGSFDLTSPEVQALVRSRVAGHIDPTEPVVSPASLLVDPDLRVVYTNDPNLPGG